MSQSFQQSRKSSEKKETVPENPLLKATEERFQAAKKAGQIREADSSIAKKAHETVLRNAAATMVSDSEKAQQIWDQRR